MNPHGAAAGADMESAAYVVVRLRRPRTSCCSAALVAGLHCRRTRLAFLWVDTGEIFRRTGPGRSVSLGGLVDAAVFLSVVVDHVLAAPVDALANPQRCGCCGVSG